MICWKPNPFNRACAATTGGISRIWIFDREDFNFTQASADADGNKPAYTVIARRTGATAVGGALLFPVKFQQFEAEHIYSQSNTKGSAKYDHSINFQLPDLGQFITNWNEKVDSASACCGIGVIVEYYSGKIVVLGEMYVNGAPILEWKIVQDGASGGSGKLFEDTNAHNAVLKGPYKRGAYEFTGGIAALTALEGATVICAVVTPTPGSTSIALAWPQVTGAAGYKVQWYSDAPGTTILGTIIKTGISNTGYTITGLTSATPYYYRVTPVDASDNALATCTIATSTTTA